MAKTLSIQTGRKLNDKSKNDIMAEVIRVLGGVLAVQICFDCFRVTFISDEASKRAKENTGVHLFGFSCKIIGGGPPVTIIHVFDYPFEEEDSHIESAMADYGFVEHVKKQTCLSKPSVYTGTRLVFMNLDFTPPRYLIVRGIPCRLWFRGQPLICNLCGKQTYLSKPSVYTGTRLVFMNLDFTPPRYLIVRGIPCRLWFRGQPLICNLCGKQGHKSADCPDKDKCRRCGQVGHFSRYCPNPWGLNPSHGAPSSVSDGTSDATGINHVDPPVSNTLSSVVNVNEGNALADEAAWACREGFVADESVVSGFVSGNVEAVENSNSEITSEGVINENAEIEVNEGVSENEFGAGKL